MFTFSIWHWIVVLAVIVLLFKRNAISDLVKDLVGSVKIVRKIGEE